ncbi:DUF1998 domain-containing protein [Agrococcus citreus]|uniref:DUF1998 domain-containing protein n=1 Tax=Agrococcus citreus TaxID=84643 RepID=A0ABP4JKS6_9MICO
MATTDRPKARQSQLVTTYGVGSLFPAGDQSFMICGIDDWDERSSPSIEEPRLARSMGVAHFRGPSSGRSSGDVPAVRFPEMHYCPNCRRLAPFWKFNSKSMTCDAPECEDRDLTPSRFVACCEDGHIEDFPYFAWVHRGAPSTGGSHLLRIETRGASSSLADIEIHCSCGVRPYNLEGSFSRMALREIKPCSGRRPWLPGARDDACGKPLRVLQRGSANVWFAAMQSAISIPPWSSPDAKFVTKYWPMLQYMPDDPLRDTVSQMIAESRSESLTVQGIVDAVRQRKGLATTAAPTDDSLRDEEYRALVDGNDGASLDTFRCIQVAVHPAIRRFIGQVSVVPRLREVRALAGFTRVTAAPTATASPAIAKLSHQRVNWLPATEVLGEGIFVRLDESVVKGWESESLASLRAGALASAIDARNISTGDVAVTPPTARFLAVHSIAHALMVELSLDAGYPVGSLRERIYAGEGQAGILLYTASSDSAGSLGGLAALGQAASFARALSAAVSRAGWCSNDPVCAESGPSGSDGLNLAACHACLLVPETSCEHRNIYLDRVTLVGWTDGTNGGLFDKIGAIT